jgi:hypothetical protein
VLHEDDRVNPSARRQLPRLIAAARGDQNALGKEGRRQPEDEAGDVQDLKERVDQGGRFRSSLRSAARS